MSKRPRPQSSSSDSDERVGRAVEEDLSSSDDNSILDKKKKTPAKPRVRLPISRRSEIIDKRKRGIDDPEFSCTQNPKTKTWIVRKRKFPLDQTIRHDEPIAPKEPVKEVEPPKEAPKEKKDLELSWANMQATTSDALTKQLTELSEKFDKLSEKYEEKKKAKSRVARLVKKLQKPKPKPVAKPKEEEYEYYSDDEPVPVPQARRLSVPQQPPVLRRLPVGVYQRPAPISISQF
jgi:hypothetical protein